MQLTIKLESDVLDVYEAFWGSLLNADIEIYTEVLDVDYRLIGTTEKEVFFNRQEAIRFLEATAVQLAGNLERRKSIINLETIDSLVLITEQFDAYVQIESNWNFYGKTRVSTWIQQQPKGWKIVQQHFSLPDTKAEEGQTIGIEKIAKENLELKEAIKRRTIELEEKNRELEIEAALERVRSISMAMHNSDELSTVVYILFTELVKLDAQLDRCLILIVDPQTLGITWYLTGKEGLLSNNGFLVPDNTHPSHQAYLEGWRTKRKKWHYLLAGEEKQRWDAFGFAETELAQLPDFIKADMAAVKAIHLTISSDEFGCLIASSLSPLSETHASIVERFTIVFNQTYTRFLDLQKAESQAREAQIEVSLERVRARTMAMQNSNELPEAANLLFQQVQSLGMPAWSAGYCIWDDNKQGITLWMSSEGVMQPSFHAPLTKDPSFIHMKEAYERKQDFHIEEVGGKELEEHYKYMRTLPVVGDVLDSIIEAGNPLPTFQIFHCVYFSQGFLLFITYEPVPEAHEIFKRFGNVFDQTYTRFLDLQKAEAQAREAQIEAALERVRSKTMAMHNSNDVGESVAALFDELTALGVLSAQDRCGIGIMQPNEMMELWTAEKATGKTELTIGYLDMRHHILLKNVYQNWLDKKETYQYILEGEDKLNYYEAMRNQANYKIRKDYYSSIERIVHTDFFFKEGCLYVFSQHVFTKDVVSIFMRFVNVFGQTYRRFLDLQKAEAQAREAQIEAALERVRAKSMAMHKSDELLEASEILFLEIQKLGIESLTAGFILMDKEEKNGLNYTPDPSTKKIMSLPVIIPHNETSHMQRVVENWKKGTSHYVVEMDEEETIKHQTFIAQRSANFTLNAEQLIAISPARLFLHNFYFKEGYLLIVGGTRLSAEQIDIMLRFAKVFQQTYTRFLDLQKAEAQTREAQIEAALERIRSRALAMHRSEEFSDVAKVMREQMGFLGQPELETSAVHLYDEDADNIFSWRAFRLSSYLEGNIISGFFKIPRNSCAIAIEFIQKFNSNATEYTIEVSGEKQTEWYEILFKLAPEVEAAMKISGTTNEIRYYHFSKFSGGALLMVSSKEPANDAIELQKRSAQVFDLAYRRFKDLQKAEAQALEAIKRASVDRVRAEIASMRTTSDLDRIQPLIWNELKTLGVPFIRCGVFIMDEAKQELQAFLSTPDGKSIAAFHLPYHSTDQSMQIVAHWQQKKIFRDHMDEKAFADYTKKLVQQGAVASDEKYVTEYRPTDLYLHFLPFLQGMLYVGNDAALNDVELQLVQNLADAFSTAYARYEDFNKLDLAKTAVESAMSELKATQSQLVQQEKLASLGQLTAGIAHEIKNPLNFVNNFSEVSIELIDEVLEEIEKNQDTRDDTLISDILKDIRSNVQKVHDHGYRANSIVTSMLQHSRGGTGKMHPTDLNALIKEYVNLSYHGMRASKTPMDVDIVLDLYPALGMVSLIKEDFTRVVINLSNNAFDAMREKVKNKYEVRGTKDEGEGAKDEEGEEQRVEYKPTLSIQTRLENGKVLIQFKDNGPGIPDEIKDKILQPFFTTKKGTEGTGLGLSITNDIVKAHGGELKVETTEGEGSLFIIKLPENT